MATLDQVEEMRRARAGDCSAQIALAKRYLMGEVGLRRSVSTAMLWLERAAANGQREAWMIIGQQIPFEIAEKSSNKRRTLVWFELAYADGVTAAGLVFAKLAIRHFRTDEFLFRKALSILEHVAQEGVAEAQWLLANTLLSGSATPEAGKAEISHGRVQSPLRMDLGDDTWKWAKYAAENGIGEAQYAMAERAWNQGDYPTYLRWALPLARQLIDSPSNGASKREEQFPELRQSTDGGAALVFRCAMAMRQQQCGDADVVMNLVKFAAAKGCRHAQLSLGQWLANLKSEASPLGLNFGQANYKSALSWLRLAGEQGLPEAWYFASKIYLKAEFAGRSVALAAQLLERAAASGHVRSQLECAVRAWRSRQKAHEGDITAAYWAQQACAQGCAEACTMIEKISGQGQNGQWAEDLLRRLSSEDRCSEPFLAARIALAAAFGLTESEALLIDPNLADQGHCMVVEVSTNRRKPKRRLIFITSSLQRQVLDRAKQLFDGIECGANGPEGDYRKRLYRLKKLGRYGASPSSKILAPNKGSSA